MTDLFMPQGYEIRYENVWHGPSRGFHFVWSVYRAGKRINRFLLERTAKYYCDQIWQSEQKNGCSPYKI